VIKKRELILLVSLVSLITIISLRAPRFLNIGNFRDILDDTSLLAMVAMGQFMVILIAGIDLSVGAGLALTGMSVALLNQYHPQIPIFAIVLLSVLIGFSLGSFNGILVSLFRIPPIIVTLGTMSIYRGFVFVISGGTWVSAHEMSDAFKNLPRGGFLGVSNLLFVAILCVITFGIFLKYTTTGREIYSVGGNEIASQYVGINLKKIKYLPFMLAGSIYGLAGLLWVARYASAQSDTALGFELQTIAACVVGGVSIFGGSGTTLGVVLGVLFLGIVNNALTQIKISPFWQMGLQGLIILVAVIINTIMEKRTQELIIRRRSL
jgi:rhamnose transport system permease protein